MAQKNSARRAKSDAGAPATGGGESWLEVLGFGESSALEGSSTIDPRWAEHSGGGDDSSFISRQATRLVNADDSAHQRVYRTYLTARAALGMTLVLAQLAAWRGDSARVGIEVDVHSAYRSPSYNRVVRAAARDSRHQYGDAVDVAIDANGDGRFTLSDARLVSQAVEAVESRYPDLVGGMGVYASRRIRHPYVHIDARGERARWRG